MPRTRPATVDEYIEAAPAEARKKLREIRAVLKKVAPDAKETRKWGAPVLEAGRILFSYAAYKSHLNFMPTGPAMAPFKEALAGFGTGKDTIRFPYDQLLPKALIRKIAAYRVEQVKEGALDVSGGRMRRLCRPCQGSDSNVPDKRSLLE